MPCLKKINLQHGIVFCRLNPYLHDQPIILPFIIHTLPAAEQKIPFLRDVL